MKVTEQDRRNKPVVVYVTNRELEKYGIDNMRKELRKVVREKFSCHVG